MDRLTLACVLIFCIVCIIGGYAARNAPRGE